MYGVHVQMQCFADGVAVTEETLKKCYDDMPQNINNNVKKYTMK